MQGLITILLVGLFIAVGLATWWTAHRLRRPPRRTYAWAVAKGAPGDPSELPSPREFFSWTFQWTTGRARPMDLPAWDVLGDDPDGPLLALSPGWGDSRLGALVRIPSLAPHCSRILAWDSPGLGEAPGKCPLGTREHLALLDLVRAADAGDRPVVLMGWSLGAVVSIAAAARGADGVRIAGVIAEAPYRQPWTPAYRVLAQAAMPWRVNGPLAFALLGMRLGVGPVWRGFDRAAMASSVSAPLLVVHGSEDAISPVDDGRSIADAAPKGRLEVIDGAGHNDLWTEPAFAEACEHAGGEFLASLRAPVGAASGA